MLQLDVNKCLFCAAYATALSNLTPLSTQGALPSSQPFFHHICSSYLSLHWSSGSILNAINSLHAILRNSPSLLQNLPISLFTTYYKPPHPLPGPPRLLQTRSLSTQMQCGLHQCFSWPLLHHSLALGPPPPIHF